MKNKKTMAVAADRFRLYEKSVQCPEVDLDFAERVFLRNNGRKPYSLREDFCASAWIASSWVKRNRNNTAVGIDLSPEVLEWSKKNHVSKLSLTQQKRIKLLQGDVMTTVSKGMDLVMALNFSYWVFMDRSSMKDYFIQVKKNMSKDGLFILDAYGGSNANMEIKEKTKFKNFTYIWEQEQFDPATGKMMCRIHFQFPDKSWIRNAFSYEWRVWTLPELQELLHESGYDTEIYWEGEDENGAGNGEYEPLQGKASADEAWISYIVAKRRS